MAFFTETHAALDALAVTLGADIAAAGVPGAVGRLADDQVETVMRLATVLVQAGECLRIAGAGVVAARSSRDAGHGGMAQIRGHRNATAFVQDLTGTTKAEAAKQVRLGEALHAADTAPAGGGDNSGDNDRADECAGADATARPWHAVLSDAYLARRLTSDQKQAILRGLGQPPITGAADADAVIAAWAAAAEQLIAEAAGRSVEELECTARTVRDLLDPDGCARRFDDRYRRRGYRTWIDSDGARHGRIDFDDEGAAWVQTIIDTALRPRRGGPRFVDAAEAAHAKHLEADERTNDQLAYDLLIDVLRAGALADATTVFGTRQAGLRVIVTHDAAADADTVAAVAVVEDDATSLPAWLATQRACDTGTVTCTVDGAGNPLDVGREQRLFTPKQRIALAVRDGGCRWHGCDRPASYCEAHHVDKWTTGGRTDIDRGILLCRYHHMALHHGGWTITRRGKHDFVLHPPPGRGSPTALPTRLARRYAFGDLAPPPPRFRPAA